MAWISLFFVFNIYAQVLPQFLTKHASDTLRYISMDGRYAYIQKKPGVLGLVTSFRSIDFLTENFQNDFLIRSSSAKNRLAIESIPNTHEEMSLLKNHRILVVDYGNTITREVGFGRNAKLHMNDEWISFYDMTKRIINLQNLVTQKKIEIKLAKKANPFFIPEVEMISSSTIIYTDINDEGYSALVAHNLANLKNNIIYKSSQSATRLELCRQEEYLAVGEFPYEGVTRGSKIQHLKLTGDVVNPAGLTSLYSSTEQDIGNMVCLPEVIYFVKTINHDKSLNYKVSEAVKLEIKTQNIEIRSNLKHVVQLIEMDGRVLIPSRGDFYVVQGSDNLGVDILKSAPSKEELQIDL